MPNNELEEELKKAYQSEGYLIMITSRGNNKLNHYRVTRNFLHDDLLKSLKEHERILKEETNKRPAESKGVPNIEGQKEMPPEYKDKNVE